jgi:hypothetical protein
VFPRRGHRLQEPVTGRKGSFGSPCCVWVSLSGLMTSVDNGSAPTRAGHQSPEDALHAPVALRFVVIREVDATMDVVRSSMALPSHERRFETGRLRV